jgi:hypothetical protein
MENELKKIRVLLWVILVAQITIAGFLVDSRLKLNKLLTDPSAQAQSEYEKKMADWQESLEAWKKAVGYR